MNRREARHKRQLRGRRKVAGTAERPRLCVFKSLRHMHVQLVDDAAGRTLACASTAETGLRAELAGTGNVAAAHAVGRLIAERARAAGVEAAVFDRAGFPYHGKVKAVAEAAREAGLRI